MRRFNRKQSLLLGCSLLALMSPLRAEDSGFASSTEDDEFVSFLDSQIGQAPTVDSEANGDIQFAPIHPLESSDFADVVSNNDCVDQCGATGCAKCKKKKAKAKPNPCAGSHKPLFYDNDFSYLNDPCYKGSCLGDALKQNPLGACGQFGTLDIGGELRVRYHHEQGSEEHNV